MTPAEFRALLKDLKTLAIARQYHIRIHPAGDEPVIYTWRAMCERYPIVIRFNYALKEAK